jgi:hypothetical protein
VPTCPRLLADVCLNKRIGKRECPLESASVEVILSADRRRGVATLTLAFAADPIMRWVWPDPYQYATYWPRIAEAYGGRAFDCGTAHVLENYAAVALWLPPRRRVR